jgi:peptide/nickel transport system ATP-binding protein
MTPTPEQALQQAETAAAPPALEVRDLVTQFVTRKATLTAVDGVSISVARGRIMALVGESGSGKSVTGLSIMGLIDPPGRIAGGAVRVGGARFDITDDRAMQRLRGDRLAMIFQDPMMTLNPVLRISRQMTEAISTHHPRVTRAEARKRAHDALALVGIPSPAERLDSFPHQLSGGMRQRVAIATALLNRPEVIIADEPTTALDVTIQSQILHEVERVCRDNGTAFIWITHDLSVVANLAHDVTVMYAGRIVESGPVREVLERPLHPYTRGLIDSVPDIDARKGRLVPITGMMPQLSDLPKGCKFAPRCPLRIDACEVEPPLVARPDGRQVRCIRPLDTVARQDGGEA